MGSPVFNQKINPNKTWEWECPLLPPPFRDVLRRKSMDEKLREELLVNLEKKRDLVINSYRDQKPDSNLWNFDKGRIIGLDYAIELISEWE